MPALTTSDKDDLPTGLFATALTHSFVITAPIAIGGYLVAEPLLLWMFGSTYAGAGAALAILIWSVPLSVFRSVGLAGLLARERQDLALKTTTSSTILNLILNVALIPPLGVIGAAWATVATEAARMTLAFVFTIRQGWPGLPVARCLRPAAAAVGMGVVVWALPEFNVLLRIAAGGATYAGLLLAVGALRTKGGLRLEV